MLTFKSVSFANGRQLDMPQLQVTGHVQSMNFILCKFKHM